MKLAAGVNVTLPSALTTTVPFNGVEMMDTLKASPSKSLSFANTFTVDTPPSNKVAASFTATGVVLDGLGLTVTDTLAVSHNTGLPLSHTV